MRNKKRTEQQDFDDTLEVIIVLMVQMDITPDNVEKEYLKTDFSACGYQGAKSEKYFESLKKL